MASSDLDYEFPATAAQGQGFADLITALRSAFTTLQKQKGDATPYILSTAVSAGEVNYKFLPVAQMDASLDFWNLMAYDYAGSWSTFADHQANLYGPSLSGYGTDAAINWYISKGASAAKINLGIPIYGRAFEATKGIGQPFNGIGPGSVEPGTYSYKDLRECPFSM
jgi:chitinase